MNTPSQSPFFCRCLRTLRVLAGFSIFGLLYTNCGPPSATIGDGMEEVQDTIKEVNATTTNSNANQANPLSRGDVVGPNH